MGGILERRHAFGKVVLLLAALASFNGCGSSDQDSTLEISGKAFLAEGNALCKATQQEQARRFKAGQEKFPPGEPVTANERNTVLTWIFVKPYEKEIRELKALGTPEDDEDELAAIFQAMEGAQKKVEVNPTKILSGSTMYEEANELLADYGLKNCVV